MLCVKGVVFKAVLNNNSVGNRQNQSSEIVGGYLVGSFGYFRGNELLEFIVAVDKLCPDFLISEQSGVEQMKSQARVNLQCGTFDETQLLTFGTNGAEASDVAEFTDVDNGITRVLRMSSQRRWQNIPLVLLREI